jgi:RHS repeat-associated protein
VGRHRLGRHRKHPADYDAAGNLRQIRVVRSGACTNGTNNCNLRFYYYFDEVGRLYRGMRYEGTTLQTDLSFVYDSADNRVIKTDNTLPGTTNDAHTLYVFDSLELRRTSHDTTNETYSPTVENEVPYLIANGVRVARVVYEGAADGEPRLDGTSPLHVFLNIADHLGSTSTVIDRDTGELVERTTYQPYGATESDYRPARWKGFREDYRFTGKEEDQEIGLTYFGKRYLSPYLGRWLTPDPLAVHAPGKADLNLYAYVHGAVLKSVDPIGLNPADKAAAEQALFDQTTGQYGADHRAVGAPAPTAPPQAPVSGEGGGGGVGGITDEMAAAGTRGANASGTSPGAVHDGGLAYAAASFAPGPGEFADIETLTLDPTADGWDKGLAAVSLGVNLLTGGVLPNYGAIRAASEAAPALKLDAPDVAGEVARLQGSAGREARPTFGNLIGDMPEGTTLGTLDDLQARGVSGRFDFVVQEGSVIVGQGHPHLAGGGRVDYAGGIDLQDGEIVEWTNLIWTLSTFQSVRTERWTPNGRFSTSANTRDGWRHSTSSHSIALSQQQRHRHEIKPWNG